MALVPSLTVLEHDPHDVGDWDIEDIGRIGVGFEPHKQAHHHQPEGDDGGHGGAIEHFDIFGFRLLIGGTGDGTNSYRPTLPPETKNCHPPGKG
jgi:hypothetical protein